MPVKSVKVNTPGAHLVVIGKGSKERIVWLEDEAIKHFRKLVKLANARGDLQLVAGCTSTLQKMWREERTRLELPEDITIHTFRHTYGTFMAYRDLVGTQRAMGHSDIKTTMRYVHEDARMIRKASAQWSAALHTDAQGDGTELVSDSERAKHGAGSA